MGKVKRKKGQSEKQRKQAQHAVTLYLELVFRAAEQVADNGPLEQNLANNQFVPTKKETFCQENKQVKVVIAQTREPAPVKKEVLESSGTLQIGVNHSGQLSGVSSQEL